MPLDRHPSSGEYPHPGGGQGPPWELQHADHALASPKNRQGGASGGGGISTFSLPQWGLRECTNTRWRVMDRRPGASSSIALSQRGAQSRAAFGVPSPSGSSRPRDCLQIRVVHRLCLRGAVGALGIGVDPVGWRAPVSRGRGEAFLAPGVSGVQCSEIILQRDVERLFERSLPGLDRFQGKGTARCVEHAVRKRDAGIALATVGRGRSSGPSGSRGGSTHSGCCCSVGERVHVERTGRLGRKYR